LLKECKWMINKKDKLDKPIIRDFLLRSVIARQSRRHYIHSSVYSELKKFYTTNE
jgi:hypothetical protein